VNFYSPALGWYPTGFLTADMSALIFYHVASDCSDGRLLYSLSVLQPSQNVAYTLNGQPSPILFYYPTSAPTLATISAVETFQSGQDPRQPGTRSLMSTPQQYEVAAPALIDLSTSGFVSPFGLK
jgi:hypothetical protein